MRSFWLFVFGTIGFVLISYFEQVPILGWLGAMVSAVAWVTLGRALEPRAPWGPVTGRPGTGRVRRGSDCGAGTGPATILGQDPRFRDRGIAALGDAAALVRDVVDKNVFAEMLGLNVEGPPIVYFRHLIDEVDEVMPTGEHEGVDRDALASAADHLAKRRIERALRRRIVELGVAGARLEIRRRLAVGDQDDLLVLPACAPGQRSRSL